MANGHGGARKGAGRKTLKFGFRKWCREVVMDKEVQEQIKAEAKTNPHFALKLAEHGFGRPPQSLDVKVNDITGLFVAEFADGEPVSPPTTEGLPN